jgi:hypothetical protein
VSHDSFEPGSIQALKLVEGNRILDAPHLGSRGGE